MLRRKLKSRRGASVVLALLVLLVCITAGTAALTAAGANTGRYTHMRADQQRYLSVASAARLVRDELCGQTFRASVVLEEKQVEEGRTVEVLDGTDPAEYTGVFRPWLLDDLKTLLRANAVPGDWWDQVTTGSRPEAQSVTHAGLELSVDDDEAMLSRVKWSLTLDDDYTIIARFYLEDKGVQYYPMVLTIPADVTEVTSERERPGAGQRYITTKTATVTWNAADAVITQS